MAGVRKQPAPTSARAAANLKRVRQRRGLSIAALARKLAGIGHPILDTGLLKTEQGARRIDVDDLVALSAALDCSPNEILLPEAQAPMVTLGESHLLTPGMTDSLGRIWAWATGEQPLEPAGPHDEAEYVLFNRPHRFTVNAPTDSPYWRNLHEMPGVVGRLFAAGLTSWQIRTMFEQAMVASLNGQAHAARAAADGQD